MKKPVPVKPNPKAAIEVCGQLVTWAAGREQDQKQWLREIVEGAKLALNPPKEKP